MTVRPTTLNLEAEKRVPVGSVLTYGDSNCANDADRFRVSGTASRLRGNEAELLAALSGACEGMCLRLVDEVWMQCRRDE